MDLNEICNFIEDLLPLYVEGLVSEKTKDQIETHLKKCDKCTKSLENLNPNNESFLDKDIVNEDINSAREIKCIKNIKRKILIKIIVAIIISIILTFFCAYIWDTYRIMEDEDGKYYIYNMKTGNIKQGINGTNMFAEYTINNNGANIKYNIIFTFNENNICINARTIISGYNENELNNFKNTWENSSFISNIKIENKKLYLNDNIYTGKTKQEIIESLQEYNASIIEI